MAQEMGTGPIESPDCAPVRAEARGQCLSARFVAALPCDPWLSTGRTLLGMCIQAVIATVQLESLQAREKVQIKGGECLMYQTHTHTQTGLRRGEEIRW